MAIQYGNSRKIAPKRFTLQEIEEAAELMQGFCIACGAVRECCEPDARRYDCEECGERHVYGAEEFMLMGLVVES